MNSKIAVTMLRRSWPILVLVLIAGLLLTTGCGKKEEPAPKAEAKKEMKKAEAPAKQAAAKPAKKKRSLDKWKPAFDPSGAKYRCIVSNVSHPVIKGVYAGIAMRDNSGNAPMDRFISITNP